MYTRRSVFVAFASLGGAAALLAQGPRPGMGAEGREKILAAMKERLNLTGEQEAKIKTILEDEGDKLKSLWEKGQQGGDRAAMRTEMREIRDGTHKQVMDVLTDEQKPEYEKMVAEARERMRDGGGRRRPDGPPQQ